jgi:hypothetical protein
MKWTRTVVAITVIVGAVTGSSAANPALALNNSRIIGFVPTGLVTSTGFGLIETMTLVQATGVVTVTTRAVVATADLTLNVIIETPSNS